MGTAVNAVSVVQSTDSTPKPPARGRQLRRGAVGTAAALLVGLAAASPAMAAGQTPEVPCCGLAGLVLLAGRTRGQRGALSVWHGTPDRAPHHSREQRPSPPASSSSTPFSPTRTAKPPARHDPDLIRSGADELPRSPGAGSISVTVAQPAKRTRRPWSDRPDGGRRTDPAHRRIRTDDDQARHRCGDRGPQVTAVGNAGGTGTLSQQPERSSGSTPRSPRPSEDGTDPETLNGMVETNANVLAGDSGGPLYRLPGRSRRHRHGRFDRGAPTRTPSRSRALCR